MTTPRAVSGLAGAAVLLAALSPPLEALAAERFAAHMVQHLALTHAAAPLLVLAGAPRRALQALPRAPHGDRLGRRPGTWGMVLLVALHLAVMVAWHVPAAYELAMEVTAVHVAEHLTMLASALAFWAVLGAGRRRPEPVGALLAFVAALVMGGLAALLSFATRPLYDVHADGGGPWALTAMQDQQLGGAIMWIPGGLVYLGAAVAIVISWITADERGDATFTAGRRS